MILRSRFYIEQETPCHVLIVDVGSDHMSVTNDAEAVVRWLLERGKLGNEQRLYYFDSMGVLGELLHDGRRLVGFGPGPNSREIYR